MNRNNNKSISERTVLELPEGLVKKEKTFPVIFVDTKEMDIENPGAKERINNALYKALRKVHNTPVSGQALLKVHIGEPKCSTRMKPEYAESSVRFLRDVGASGTVSGDTTVAYSGPRGRKQNPVGDASKYLQLAHYHGWSEGGPAGAPFVILDRPSTSKDGYFEFDKEEKRVEVHGIHRFKDFFLAGGFAGADFVINHAHLTLHGLAGVAGCVKSLAMGCSSLKGKLRMHQSLLPLFDDELCVSCGKCVDNCPENALKLNKKGRTPIVYPELCIGCGECEAVCEKRAVTLQGENITDWERGKDSLSFRIADYTIGLMNGRWGDTIHVLHMYTITGHCDCLNIRQEPMLKQNLGFLVGKNPFAIDKLAGKMLGDSLAEQGRNTEEPLLKTAETTANYIEKTYGIFCKRILEREVVL